MYVVKPASHDSSDPEEDSLPKVGFDSLVYDPALSSSSEYTVVTPSDGRAGSVIGYSEGQGATYIVDVYDIGDPSVIQFPVSEDYGMVAYWNMENPARDGIALHGGAATAPGFDNNAIQFASASQYGVIENDGGILDGAKALVVEAWVNVKSASLAGGALAYLVHKPRPSGPAPVFALALANNFCSKSGTRLIFGVPPADNDSLTCATTAIANKTVELDSWIYVTAVWDGKYVALYQDGSLVSRRAVSNYSIDASANQITFGGGDANVKMDNVRLGVLPITADDVLYRYYIGGVL